MEGEAEDQTGDVKTHPTSNRDLKDFSETTKHNFI
jgi:hypothetical protein